MRKRVIQLLLIAALGAFSSFLAGATTPLETKDANNVLSLPVGPVTFGMRPMEMVQHLKQAGYSVNKSPRGGETATGVWILTLGSSPGDRTKIIISARNGAAVRMQITFVSGENSSYDMHKEAARLIEHFGKNPCENRREMYRCYFPDGDKMAGLVLRASLDSRMYSLEFQNNLK